LVKPVLAVLAAMLSFMHLCPIGEMARIAAERVTP
jgi:hypothetical protein